MELKLVLVGGKHAGTAIPIPGPKFLIGRGEDCQFRPQSKMVSRKHCAILVQDSSVTIEDSGSTNGTFVNGEKIQQRELKNGDRIKVGVFELQVELSATLEGKKKPKVHNVQEAAVRTVAAAAAPDGELDVSGWLADDDQDEKPAAPPENPPSMHDTFVGKSADETATLQASHGQPEKDKEKDKEKPSRPKVASTSLRAAKPIADSSRSAAEDVLRHFFPRKKA
jgi:pSer/pThr/pTyr-binding forkhead associated (FHA) protein